MAPAEIDEMLRAQTLARIACQRDGTPYIVPVAYAFDGESILVHSLEGTKVDIMRKNPRVCVQVDTVDHMTSWRSVMAWGDFEELRGEHARAALGTLVTRLLPPGASDAVSDPFAPPGLEDRVVLFRIKLGERQGRVATP